MHGPFTAQTPAKMATRLWLPTLPVHPAGRHPAVEGRLRTAEVGRDMMAGCCSFGFEMIFAADSSAQEKYLARKKEHAFTKHDVLDMFHVKGVAQDCLWSLSPAVHQDAHSAAAKCNKPISLAYLCRFRTAFSRTLSFGRSCKSKSTCQQKTKQVG